MIHAQRARIAMEREQSVVIVVKGTPVVMRGRVTGVDKEGDDEVLTIAVDQIKLSDARKAVEDANNLLAFIYASDVAVFIVASE